MTPLHRAALAVLVGGLVVSLGCDRSRERAAEEEALRNAPPVRTGNVTEGMAGERVPPKLPSPDDRLLVAIRNGERDKAELWLSEGAAIDPAAPMLVAAVRGEGDVDFLEWLVGSGAGVDVPDPSGRTPLSWAAGEGDDDEVRYLLASGADVTTTDQLGRTPLHYAVFSGEVGVVVRLLEASAGIDTADSLGTTALMYACAKNHGAIVDELRDRGADSSLKDKLGRTAAERAHGDDNRCATGGGQGREPK